MTARQHLLINVAVALLFGTTELLLGGCSRGARPDGTVWVTGRVRHDGRDLPTGIIHFLAKEGSGSGGARVTNGAFGLYLAPKVYRVAVVSKAVGGDTNDGQEVSKPENFIPSRYNATSTSGLEVEVTSSRPSISIDLTP